MATRNLYAKISKTFQGKENLLQKLLVTIWLGGFVLIVFLSKLTDDAQFYVGIGGRIWFTLCMLLGVIYMATSGFNPDRDPVDRTLNESWAVIVLNSAILMAIYVWFM